MSKQKRLGRGLEALLGRGPAPAGPLPATPDPYEKKSELPPPEPEMAVPPVIATPPRMEEPAADAPVQAEPVPADPPVDAQAPSSTIDIDRIDSNKSQPRKDFDARELDALSESIADHGLLQPVVVRRVEDRYELIAGERRLRAAKQAGWSEVPANVIEADDRKSAELAIVENMQRKDLNPLEKAASFQRYIEQYSCTQEELAGRLKMNRSTVANMIRLLELPEEVKEALRHSKITQGHARSLLPLGEEQEQVKFCNRIQRERLSVRQTETLVQETIKEADGNALGVVSQDGKSTRQRGVQSEHIAALEQELRSALGTKVKITQNARGRGKLVIHFGNHQEFERLRDQLSGPSMKSKAG